MIPSGISIEVVLQITRRIPFGSRDRRALQVFIDGARKRRLDLTFGCDPAHAQSTLSDGFVALVAPSLAARFVFINADAGKGWLGAQKANVLAYTSDLHPVEYYAGPVRPSLLRALVGVSNLYRQAGLLKGAGIWPCR